MSSHLATHADAQLILTLYELRTEPVMREAREWLLHIFHPVTAEDVFALLADSTSQESGYLRQVTSYWEMAASFVLRGALSEELFVDCNGEPFYLYATFLPLLPAIRERVPTFLSRTGELIEHSKTAKERVTAIAHMLETQRTAKMVAQ